MKNRKLVPNSLHLPLIYITAIILLLSYTGQSQDLHSIDDFEVQSGEKAFCEIKISNPSLTGNAKSNSGVKKAQQNKTKQVDSKKYQLQANEFGLFDQVSGIQPKQKVPVQLNYPAGRVGEKVAIIMLDGGTLDNGKKVKVTQLDTQKKMTFELQVTSDPGLYRVLLKKGSDTKTVQLWVGPKLPMSHNKL
ncbi:hypothetical protein [Adhaeribacter radiodurans]|uniref:Uncharacterized protein n=1 Tax=Adhaeribacter radiodurans TaxID=2745197 RepID=A0A7L7LBK2_9BACT|nr:hypothetical protein [Adhaeribacter radiodurans]QMU30143.1 hypothetical protein HUW48_19855 [Adhaeribacter radiodurans]